MPSRQPNSDHPPCHEQQLAKLTRPRLRGAVARERLFALLDRAREDRPACCVVSPPGSGKTTLVASWLDARSIKSLWYQVDPGDADLSTFFYYLGQGALPFTRKGRQALPLLTPEYLNDIAGFSRRFFRELFARLPAGGVLVLDNYQEIAAGHRFHELIAQAVEEVPEGITLIAVSRRDPPECYARLIANQDVAFLDWEHLKLTLDQASSIAKSKSGMNADEVRALYQRSEGWAAGLTLLLEGNARQDRQTPDSVRSGREALFSYFVTQILMAVPPATKELLMVLAHLSQIPESAAVALSGQPGAADILEDLWRRHLFTHRRDAQERTYWFHALFREFLQEQAKRTWTAAQLRALKARLAQLLIEHGAHDEAVSLLIEAQRWNECAQLVTRQASELIAQGRGETLRQWIDGLPSERVQSDPWLKFWRGASLIAVDQQEARRELESAYEGFALLQDTLGQVRIDGLPASPCS